MKKKIENVTDYTIDDLTKMSKEELIQNLIKERRQRIELINQINQPKPNSLNSSRPPSTDNSRDRALRNKKPKSKKKTGGQSGHVGKTLDFQVPTKIINLYRYTPDKEPGELISSCQITNIKFDKEVIEYRLYSTRTKTATTVNTILPTNYTAYSDDIKGLIAYLSVEQAISEERVVRLFNDVFEIQLSSGLISKVLEQANNKFNSVYRQIHTQIANSQVLGSDETFMNLEGKQVYLWNWNNPTHSYFRASTTRKYLNIQSTIPNFKGVLVTDRLPVQLKHSCDHQICTVHLQRDIKKLPDSNFKAELQNIIGSSQKAIPSPASHQYFTSRLKLLLDTAPPIDKLSITLYKSLSWLKDSIFRFLSNSLIPHHNNSTERELRKSKIKHKITGGFRTEKGFDTYAKILSFIQTCRKQNQNVWRELLALYQGKELKLQFGV
jgi:transposase